MKLCREIVKFHPEVHLQNVSPVATTQEPQTIKTTGSDVSSENAKLATISSPR